jgi:hypothetical protein
MTSRRVAGRERGRRILPAAVLTLAIAAIVAACGSISPSGSQAASGVAAGSARASVVPAPSASAGGSGRPRATAWPGNAVLGIEALGVADGQITAAIADFGRGIQAEDLVLMRHVADQLAGVDVLLPNMDKIDIFEPMRPFAARYGAAIRAISAAATALRSAIDAGDAARITTATQDLVAGFELYTSVQPELATWIQQSIEQRRLLTQ